MENNKPRISGAWRWREILHASLNIDEQVNFWYQKNHTIFKATQLKITNKQDSDFVELLYSLNDNLGEEIANAYTGWAGDGYEDTSVLYFGEEPQEVSANFYTYLMNNAEPIEWNSIARWIGTSVWEWKDALVAPSAILGFANVTVGNTVYDKALFVVNNNVISGGFNNTGCFYLSCYGWLDGSISLDDLINGVTPKKSNVLQTWAITGGYVSILAYDYLTQNAEREQDLLIKKKTVEGIAKAIRKKTGKISSLTAKEMEQEILAIPQEGGAPVPIVLQEKSAIPSTLPQEIVADDQYDGLSKVSISGIQTEEKSITKNGDYEPTSGKFFSKVSVNIPDKTPMLQEKSVTPSAQQQNVTADKNYDGLSKVTVDAVPIDSTNNTIKSNGTHTPASGKFFDKVTVNVPDKTFKTQSKSVKPSAINPTTGTVPNPAEYDSVTPDTGFDGLSEVKVEKLYLQEKTVTPTDTGQLITPTTSYGYVGLSKVHVKKIPSEYVIPSGTRYIENIYQTTYDVSKYAEVELKLPIGEPTSPIIPSEGGGRITASVFSLQAFTAITISPIPIDDSYNGDTETKKITANGTYSPARLADGSSQFFKKIVVDVPTGGEAPKLVDNVTVDANVVLTAPSDGILTPSEGYVGFKQVTVNIPVYKKEAHIE